MAAIDAVITDTGRNQLAQHLVLDVAQVQFSFFKIGEGGFVEAGAVKTPKVPSATLTRLEADGTVLTGTLTFSNGSPNVSGSGSSFLSEIQIGEFVRLDADLVWAQVSNIVDDNNLILTGGYTGVGGAGPGSTIGDALFVFQKTFVGTDLTFEGDGLCTAVAFLDFSEANDDGFGSNPEFFEVGFFDTASNMIAYGTFPGETKTIDIQFNKIGRVAFQLVFGS